MRPLGRRLLFAPPLLAPMAVAATVKGPTPPLIDGGPLKSLNELATALSEWKPLAERARDLAATLGIPHDEPRAWTNEEVALTLGLDVQRDGIVVSAMAVRT